MGAIASRAGFSGRRPPASRQRIPLKTMPKYRHYGRKKGNSPTMERGSLPTSHIYPASILILGLGVSCPFSNSAR